MKQKTEAEYKAWINEVESRLTTPEKKAAFKALVEGEEGMELFGGHLREADYYRRLNEHTAESKKLEDATRQLEDERAKFSQNVREVASWYEQEKPRKAALEQEAKALRAQLSAAQAQLQEYGLEDPSRDVRTPKSGKVDEDDLREEIKVLKASLVKVDQTLPGILKDMSRVLYTGIKEGYEFDPEKVIDHSINKGVDLFSSFETLVSDQRAKRAEEQRQKEIEKAKEEGRREALSKLPDPTRIRLQAPASLENITAAPVTQQDRVSAAVKDYLEMSVS